MSINLLKKFSAATLCIFLIISGVLMCSAAEQRYTISELDDMTIYLPDDMTAATRSSKDTDKYFSVFGLDYDATMKNFKDGDIYLQGMDNLSAVTVTVTMTKTEESQGIENYNLLQADKLSEITNNFLSQNEYSACTPGQADNIIWLNFNTNVNNNGTLIKAYQANTVYNGMSINITLQRNAGNVTAQDYAVFSNIVSSVSFLKTNTSFSPALFIIIGAAVVLIILIILIAVFSKKAKRRGKRNKNDKIVRELADKYNLNSKSKFNNASDNRQNNRNTAEEDEYSEEEFTDVNKNFSDSNLYEPDIYENDEVKIYTGKKNTNVEVSEEELNDIIDSTRKFNDESTSIKPSDNAEIPAVKENTLKNDEDDNSHTESSPVYELDEFEDGDNSDSEDEDYNNDEELVRQEARRTKFYASDDFFEEAPKKTMGVISSREIRDAEDFDVINEVERRVNEVESDGADSGTNFAKTAKNIFGKIKSFGTHCKYFCINVSRMIKRKKAIKKRKKAEEERRERARMRAARERQQRRNMQNGLVQVHKRSESSVSRNTSSPRGQGITKRR